jgi:hypothetical protein
LTGYVPYTGATQNVDLGEFGLDTGFVNLDTTPTNTPTSQGTIYWDDSRSTAALIMNGTLQHIGQDTFFYVKNSTGSSIAKGTAVRFNGTDGASGHLLIAPFLANGTYPSNYFMGVTAETIANGSFGQVMHFGELGGINTSGYTAGALLYASTTVAGGFQTTAPVAPNNIVLIAAAINSKNNGDILVRPTYGSNINQDEGVKIVSPTTGQLLQLQSNGLWENKTKAQVLGGTSSQFVKGDGSLDSTTYQSTSEKGQPNGYASLDSNGKVPLAQINDALIGNVNYQGLWNAATNTPTLVNPPSSGTKGYYYIVSTAGTFAGISFEVGDWIISNGSAWQKVDNTDAVSSVFGRTGNVIAANGDYNTSQVTENTNLYFTNARVLATALTGYTLGTNTALADTDTILGAFGKVQGQLNAKQNTLTNPVTGTGTNNYLPKFTGTTTIGNSAIQTNSNGDLMVGSADAGNAGIINVSVGIAGSTSGGLQLWASNLQTHYIQFGDGTTGDETYAGYIGYSHSTNALVFGTDSGNRMRIFSDGNVSISNFPSNAGYKLDVNGTGRFFGNLTAASFIRSGGTSAQFLKADGSVDSTSYVTIDTNQTITGVKTFSQDIIVNNVNIGKGGSSVTTNTRVGSSALLSNTTGFSNTAFGFESLRLNTTGGNNTAIGQEALENNIVGAFNTAVGFQSLQSNTNSSNTAIGYFSLKNNTSGSSNFAGGSNALENNTTGILNVAVGFSSLQQNTTGSYNVAIGDDAGRYFLGSGNLNTISSNSIYIGSQTRALANNQTNQIVIGHNAIGNGSNTVTIGNSSTTDNYFTGNIRGGAFIKSGGTSSQFLKADGSVDSTSYGTGSVTSVAALTLGTSGTDLSSTVANGTTTPVITLNVPTASATNRGALSAADWTTFNNKQNALTNPVTGTGTTNYLPKFTGTSTIGNSIVSDNGSRILINTGTTNQNTTINASKIAMSRTSDGAEVVYFSKNTDLGSEGTANIHGYDGIQFRTQGAETVKATLNASGNLGLGVTPSAWGTSFKAIQVGYAAVLWGTNSSNEFFVGNNYYVSSTGRRYLNNGFATEYFQFNGEHSWQTAPSGTAGNAISFTQAMTLGSNSGLSIGTPSAAPSQGLLVQGNVGIGVGPVLKLDVQGNAADTTTVGGVTVEQVTLFRPSNGVGGIRSGFNTSTGDAYLWSAQSSGNLYLGTRVAPNNNVNVAILSSGNVGIGTASPSGGLEVSRFGTYSYFSSNANATFPANVQGISLGWNSSGGGGESIIAYNKGGGSTGGLVFANNDGGSYSEKMRITSGGDVIVGYNQTTTTTIGRTFATTHASVNRGATLFYGINDGSNGGMFSYNVASSVAGFNSQYITFETHEGAVSAGERMRITSLGNVGIGTASPAAILHTSVTTNGNSVGALFANPNQAGTADAVSINFGLGRSVDAFLFSIPAIKFGKEQQWTSTGSTVDGYLAFSTILNETAAERMRITAAGNVGIGTTTPTYTLEVNSGSSQYVNARFYSSSHSLLMIESTTAARQAILVHKSPTREWTVGLETNGDYLWYDNTAAAHRMRITSGGNVGIGTASPSEKLHVAGGNIIVNSAQAFGFGDRSAQIVGNTGASGFLRFDTNNAEQLRIFSNGNVLIQSGGTFTNAGFKLDVNGTGRFSGDLVASSNIYSGGSTSLVTSTGVLAQSEVVQIFNGGAASTNIDKIADLILANNMSFTDGVIGRIIGVNNNLTSADKRVGQIAFGLDGATNSGAIGFATMSSGTFATRLTIASTGAATFSSSVTATQGIFTGSLAERVRMTRSSVGSWDLAISATNRFSIYDVAGAEERISITSGGNVGIGGSPTFKLDVQNNTQAITRILDTSTNASLVLQAGTGSGMKVTGYNYTTSTAIPLYISVDGANTIMQSGGGNVLIGTTTDNSNKLRVNGNVWVDGNVAVNALTCTSGEANTFINPIGSSGIIYSGASTTGIHQFLVNSAEQFAVTNTGIRTSAPTGGSVQNWKLGNAVNGTVNANRLIRVEIAGVGYDLVARQII